MATYFVGFGGNDGNAGTSYALRKATLSAGLALCTSAGDILVVTGSSGSPFVAAATAVPGTLGGTATNPTFIVGGNPSTGVIDGSIGYISGGGSATTGFNDSGGARSNIWFANLDFRNFNGNPLSFTNASSAGITAIGCNFQANAGYGTRLLNGNCSVIRCSAISNTSGGGFECYGNVVDSVIRNCTGIGVRASSQLYGPSIVDCVISGMSSHGVELVSGTAGNIGTTITRCTINDNGGSGVRLTNDDGGGTVDISWNIISNNDDAGIKPTTGTALIFMPRYNHYHNNTGGNLSGASVLTYFSQGETTGDPQFIDAAGGDFRVAATSPARRSDGRYAGASAMLLSPGVGPQLRELLTNPRGQRGGAR